MGRVRSDKRRYLRRLLWARIQGHPGIAAKELRASFGWNEPRVRNILHELKRDGFAYHTGWSSTSRWFVTDKKPECMWGLHPNSLANLEKVTLAERMENLRKAGKIPHKDKPLPVAIPGCELDRCWPVSMSCAQAVD